jgi:hypothetical protein
MLFCSSSQARRYALAGEYEQQGKVTRHDYIDSTDALLRERAYQLGSGNSGHNCCYKKNSAFKGVVVCDAKQRFVSPTGKNDHFWQHYNEKLPQYCAGDHMFGYKTVGAFQVRRGRRTKQQFSVKSSLSANELSRVKDLISGAKDVAATGCCLQDNLAAEIMLSGDIVCDPKFKKQHREIQIREAKSRMCPGFYGNKWKARAGTFRVEEGKIFYRPSSEASDALKERGMKAAFGMKYDKRDYACCLDMDETSGEEGEVVCEHKVSS